MINGIGNSIGFKSLRVNKDQVSKFNKLNPKIKDEISENFEVIQEKSGSIHLKYSDQPRREEAALQNILDSLGVNSYLIRPSIKIKEMPGAAPKQEIKSPFIETRDIIKNNEMSSVEQNALRDLSRL